MAVHCLAPCVCKLETVCVQPVPAEHPASPSSIPMLWMLSKTVTSPPHHGSLQTCRVLLSNDGFSHIMQEQNLLNTGFCRCQALSLFSPDQ